MANLVSDVSYSQEPALEILLQSQLQLTSYWFDDNPRNISIGSVRSSPGIEHTTVSFCCPVLDSLGSFIAHPIHELYFYNNSAILNPQGLRVVHDQVVVSPLSDPTMLPPTTFYPHFSPRLNFTTSGGVATLWYDNREFYLIANDNQVLFRQPFLITDFLFLVQGVAYGAGTIFLLSCACAIIQRIRTARKYCLRLFSLIGELELIELPWTGIEVLEICGYSPRYQGPIILVKDLGSLIVEIWWLNGRGEILERSPVLTTDDSYCHLAIYETLSERRIARWMSRRIDSYTIQSFIRIEQWNGPCMEEFVLSGYPGASTRWLTFNEQGSLYVWTRTGAIDVIHRWQ